MDSEDGIIQLDTIRINRRLERKCTCEPYNKRFTVDTVNREVTCGCGMTVDPFEAMKHLAEYTERMNEQHKAMNEQRRQWAKEKPHSVLFKQLEREYRRGEMLPRCPSCESLIEFDKLAHWVNAKFYLQRKSAERPNG